MTYYIIIRGPLACGKTTIAKILSKILKAQYFSVDEVLDEHGLTKDREKGYISQKSCLKANEINVKRAKKFLNKGIPVIFDGNFYWKSQIEDLILRLKEYPHFVFTLKAPVEVCIARDIERGETHGADAARVVHKKVSEFDYGNIINISGSLERGLADIFSYLPKKN